MDFIMITCLAMLVSVFLTYKATGYLGLDLRLKPLFCCAACAVLINFALPLISLYFAKFHLSFLLGGVVFAAFLISRYNESLNAAFSFSEQPITEIVPTLYQLQEPMRKQFIKEVLSLPIPPEPTVVFQPIAPAEPLLSPVLAAEKTSFFPLLNPPALIRASVADLVKSDMENAKLLKLTAVIAKLPSLDSILEYAYDQNRQKAYSNSIFAFKQALERYESDDYAPFIVIEIGNIYKNSGLYDEAIAIYHKAFSLPAVVDNESLIQEFQNNISYLRITKTILLKHGCPKLALSQIPFIIMQEIENEFTCWRNQKYAS